MNPLPPIKLDPNMPKDEIRFGDLRTGEVLGRIYNIGADPGEELTPRMPEAGTYGAVERTPPRVIEGEQVGIPAHSDMFYENGVLRSSTTAPTYGGVSRAPRLEDYVTVPVVSPAVYEAIKRALDEQEARTGAAPLPPQDAKQGARTIQGVSRVSSNSLTPVSVEKITPTQKFGLDMPSAKPEEWDEPLRPSPLMRRLGYTAHPDGCSHHRKRLMLGSEHWHCSDCGVTV